MVAELVVEGRPNAGEGGQVDHGVEGPVGEMILSDVALAELHPVRQREFGPENVEGSDLVAGGVELADDVGADEAGRTGDENGERGRE